MTSKDQFEKDTTISIPNRCESKQRFVDTITNQTTAPGIQSEIKTMPSNPQIAVSCSSPGVDLNLSKMSIEEGMEDAKHIRDCGLVFFFNVLKKEFIGINIETNKWYGNDLSKSTLDLQKKNYKGDTLMLAELLRDLPSMSMIAINTHSIHLIGKSHYVYDLRRNEFTPLPSPHGFGTNPLLCQFSDNIYAFCGVETSHYTTKSLKYDVALKRWVKIKDMPQAHAEGVLCSFKNFYNSEKILFLGGYMRKNHLQYNSQVSIYDVEMDRWEVKSYENMTNIKEFSASNTKMVYNGDGRFTILRSMDNVGVYEFDLCSFELTRKKDMPSAQLFEDRIIESVHCTEDNRIAAVLIDRLSTTAKSKVSKGMTIMIGKLNVEKWGHSLVLDSACKPKMSH